MHIVCPSWCWMLIASWEEQQTEQGHMWWTPEMKHLISSQTTNNKKKQFLKRFFYFDKWHRYEKRQRDLPSTGSLPIWLQGLGLRQAKAQSQELPLGRPYGQHTGLPHCFPRSWMGTGTSGTQTHVHMRCQHCRQQLKPLGYNTSCNIFFFNHWPRAYYRH